MRDPVVEYRPRTTLIPIPLYDYQEKSVSDVNEANERGLYRVVVELPTGAGKTRMAMEMVRLFTAIGEYCLFLVPTIDLALQAYEEALKWFPPHLVGLIQAENNETGRWLTIASVDTLAIEGRRNNALAAMGWNKYSVVICDEADVTLCEKYATVFRTMAYPRSQLIGITATPYRHDGQSLRKVFWHGLVSYVDMLDLCAQGRILYPRAHRCWCDTDLTNITLKGLYDDQEKAPAGLMDRILASNRYEMAFRSWEEVFDYGRVPIFANDVDDAYGFARYFEHKGVPSSVITGKITGDSRKAIYDALHDGSIPILSNYHVLTAGWNEPRIRGVIIACFSLMGEHPNIRLHTQIVGRGSRLSDETDIDGNPIKQFNEIVYLVTKEYPNVPPLMSMGMLPGTIYDQPKSAPRVRTIPDEIEEMTGEKRENWEPVEISVKLQEIRHEASNLFIRNGWQQQMDGTFTLTTKAGTLSIEPEGAASYAVYLERDGMRRTRLPELKASPQLPGEPSNLPRLSPLEEVLARGDHYLKRLELQEQARRGEENMLSTQPLTEDQLNHLKNQKVWLSYGADWSQVKQSDYYKAAAELKANRIAFRKNAQRQTERLTINPGKGIVWKPVGGQKPAQKQGEKKGRTTDARNSRQSHSVG
jgi:superfamily II DNA or RNA helicase